MIVVDLFVLLFVLGILVVGAPIAAKKLLGMDPKRKAIEAARQQEEVGEVNTVKFNLDQLRHCSICHKLTDPAKDLRTAETWVHTDCYLNSINQNKKGNA